MAQLIKRRITDALSEIPIRNGEYLKGEHLKLFRDVLSAGINANKNDIDLITSGDPNVLSFYTTYHKVTGNMLFTAMENLEQFDAVNPLPVGTRVVLYESGDFEGYGVYVVRKTTSGFEKQRLSMVTDEDRARWDRVSISDIMLGVATVYSEQGITSGLHTIDGVELKVDDTVLVAGEGEASGLYRVQEGPWIFIKAVGTNQVLSIELGKTHGGSMFKRTEAGSFTVVKKPERSTWTVLK